MRKIPACREIIRLAALGCSDNKISQITGSVRRTVKRVREKAVEMDVSWPLDDFLDDERIYYMLFPQKEYRRKKRCPDLERIHYLLTDEPEKIKAFDRYLKQCEDDNEIPVKYSRFCGLLQEEEEEHRVTSDKKLKPGEVIFTLWLEYPVKISDSRIKKAYIFLGILPFSQYVFVKAYKDRGINSWIEANTKMLTYFGGSPKEIITTGTRNGRTKGMTDKKYMDLIEHYGILLAKDSDGRFEAEMWKVFSYFEEKVEDREFDTLFQLDEVLEQAREELLREPVRGKKSREQIFIADEKPYLRELPEDAYYATVRKPAQVQRNSHIAFEKRYYSVPYQLLLEGKTRVEIEVTNKSVSIYYKDTLVAQHPNMKKEYQGTYSTHIRDMPSEEEEMKLEWNRDTFLKRADRAGRNTHRVIDELINTKPIRQQTYRVCDMILRLGTEYTYKKLEQVCAGIKYVKNGSVYMTIKEELEKMGE